jgi:CRP-like cAMP-binding protein
MLLTIEKVMVLKSVHVFAGVPEDVLANLSSYLEETDVAAGEMVYEKGDLGDTMFIIVDGKARVHDEARTFVELGARDFFGELTTLDPEPHSASVSALEDTRLLGLHRDDLYELMSGYPEVLKGIIHELCNRLRGKRTEDNW